jgi:signal transduction histidine kinase/DNA-binding response OmpR family regulator/PAS domain-containing protein
MDLTHLLQSQLIKVSSSTPLITCFMENKTIKILAIDDNRDNLISLKAIISDVLPQSVVYMELSGQGGIETAREIEPDVILLDIVMPVMNGYEVCKTLKADIQLSETPVIFLTALKGDKQSRILALEAGGEAFLAKPIDSTELKAQILAMVKIKEATTYKRDEKLQLEELVQKRTEELKIANIAALNLLEDLKTENEIRKLSEAALRESEKQYAFLTRTAFDLVQFYSIHNIYAYAARKLYELMEDKGIVAIVEYDSESNLWKMQHIEGIDDKYTDLIKFFGFDIRKLEGEISTKYYEKIISSKLEELEFDFPGLFNNKLSDKIGHTAIKLLSLDKIYCIAFQEHEQIFGNITLVTKKNAKPLNADLIEAFVLQVTNFVKKQKSEEALRMSKELLLETGHIGKVGGWSFNIDNMQQKWTDEVYRIHEVDTSIQPSVEAGINYYTMESRPIIEKAVQRAIEHGENYDLELEIITAIGNRRKVHTIGKADLKNRRIYGFFQDITEQKLAEEKLRNLSEMQSIILRIASEYINMPQELVDKSINNSLKELGEFVQADRAYVFEYDWIKNVCNNTFEWCDEGINPEIDNLQNVPNEVIDYWVEAHKNGKEMSIDDVMQLPPNDGVRQILEPQGVKSVLALPMMKLDKCIGFIGFDSVIKNHKYSEQEKTLLKVFSEMLVNIGNRKELEKNLVHAKEKAEESDRLKSAFLANMSHEIRTPMNGILGFAQILKEPDLTGAEQQQYIEIIEKSGARMLNIINDIIHISKIEAGLMEFDIVETNINEQIEYIFTFFKPEAEAKGIKLYYTNPLPSREAIIKTDREKVYAILTNLVKNAIKYSHEGSIEFGYKNKGEVFEFYVKDTGIGIPKDRQEAIFERFIQADIFDKMAKQGAGLGLSISKAYVEMLGGKIWVESQEGKGSTFYFTLPYNAEPVKEIIDRKLEPSKKNDSIRKLKILVAEDDKVSEMLIDSFVKPFCKEILKARTGVEAVAACLAKPDIDLILMDIRMPKLGGYEATQQIREFNKEVVIIAQTAHGLTGDREKAIESGCNDYISKPINKDELHALIIKYSK